MDYINPIYMFCTMFIKMLCYLTASILIEAAICIIFVVIIEDYQNYSFHKKHKKH